MGIKRQNLNISFSCVLVAMLCASCATKEHTYWTKKRGTIIVHHVRRINGQTRDRTERLTSNTLKPAEIHAYDLGRLPDGNGGMHEAHEYYRVVQSETFDLRLPSDGKAHVTRGPKTVFTPPTYSPPPESQRLNDAIAEAQASKEKLDQTRGAVEQQLANDNNLRGEMQGLLEQNQRLQDQVNTALAMGKSAPMASPSPSTARQAGTQAVDPLVQWGQKVSTQP
jgi:hypothetical protein